MHSEWSRYFCAHTRHDITSCPHNTLKSLWRVCVYVCVFPPPLAFCPLYLISPRRLPVFQFYLDRFCDPTEALAVIKKLKCTSLQNKKSLGRQRGGLFLLVLRSPFSLPLILISWCTFLNLTHFGGERRSVPAAAGISPLLLKLAIC